jgi:predicted transcriptional regulator
MITQINVLIDANLKLLYKSKDNSLNIKDFKDNLGNKFQDAETFARIMQKKELITPNLNEESCYKLTEIGRQVFENGGWLKHLENQKKVEFKAKRKNFILKSWIKEVFRVTNK